MFKSNRFRLILLAAAAFFVAIPSIAGAADFRISQDSTAYRVQTNDKVRNLYTFAADVIVDASVNKDVVAAGRSVTINGVVADDAALAGSAINVNNDIKGSARIAGGTVNINGKIGEDLLVAGGTVYVSPKSSVAGDIVAAGGSVILDGPVAGNVIVRGGQVTINSEVKGNVRIEARQSLQLGPNAKINGALDYRSVKMLEKDPTAQVIGPITYNKLELDQRNAGAFFAGLFTIAVLIKLIGLLVLALVALAVFKKPFIALVQRTGRKFWSNVGLGLVILIVVPIVSVLLLITVIGIYLAFALMIMYFAALIFGWVAGAVYFGSAVLRWLKQNEQSHYLNAVVGIVLAGILSFVPVLGIIFALILLLAGLGAFAKLLNDARR